MNVWTRICHVGHNWEWGVQRDSRRRKRKKRKKRKEKKKKKKKKKNKKKNKKIPIEHKKISELILPSVVVVEKRASRT